MLNPEEIKRLASIDDEIGIQQKILRSTKIKYLKLEQRYAAMKRELESGPDIIKEIEDRIVVLQKEFDNIRGDECIRFE